MDESDYLSDAFAPERATVQQLRDILRHHGQKVVTRVRKQDLVNRYNQVVFARRHELRAARDRGELPPLPVSASALVDSRKPPSSDLGSPLSDEAETLATSRTTVPPAPPGRKNVYVADGARNLHYTPIIHRMQTSIRPSPPESLAATPPVLTTLGGTTDEESVPVSSASSDEDKTTARKPMRRLSVSSNEVESLVEEADKSNFSTDNPFQQVPSERSLEHQKVRSVSAITGRHIDQIGHQKNSTPRPSRLPLDSPHDFVDSDESTSFSQSLRNVLQAGLTMSPQWLQRPQTGSEKSSSSTPGSEHDTDSDNGLSDEYDEEYLPEDNDDIAPDYGTLQAPASDVTADGGLRYIVEGPLAWLIGYASALYVALFLLARASQSCAIGFCDTGTDINSELAERKFAPQNHAWTPIDLIPAAWMPLECTACPEKGECRNGKFAGCTPIDYIPIEPGWASLPIFLRPLIPLSWEAPTCVPDTQKHDQAQQVGNEIVRTLAIWHGRVKCGASSFVDVWPDGRRLRRDDKAAGALPVAQVRDGLWGRMDGGIEKGYFDQIFDMALAERLGAGAIQSPSLTGSEPYIYTDRAVMPLMCQTRLAVRGFLRRARLYGLGLVFVLLSGYWVRARLRSTAQVRSKVRTLVQIALDQLAANAAHHVVHPAYYPNTWLAVAQLRDELLADVYNVAQRKRLWAKVAQVVEGNTNVRTRQTKISGDWVKAWEWIGTLSAAALAEANADTSQGGLSVDPDRTGASAVEASRMLRPRNSALASPDETGKLAEEDSRSLRDDVDRTGVSAVETSRVLQPSHEPEMVDRHNMVLQGRYF